MLAMMGTVTQKAAAIIEVDIPIVPPVIIVIHPSVIQKSTINILVTVVLQKQLIAVAVIPKRFIAAVVKAMLQMIRKMRNIGAQVMERWYIAQVIHRNPVRDIGAILLKELVVNQLQL